MWSSSISLRPAMVGARIIRNFGFLREKIKENSPTITTSDGFSEIIFPALLTFSENLRWCKKFFKWINFYFYIKNEELFQLGIDLLSQLFDSEFFFVKLVYKWVKTVQNIFFLFFSCICFMQIQSRWKSGLGRSRFLCYVISRCELHLVKSVLNKTVIFRFSMHPKCAQRWKSQD